MKKQKDNQINIRLTYKHRAYVINYETGWQLSEEFVSGETGEKYLGKTVYPDSLESLITRSLREKVLTKLDIKSLEDLMKEIVDFRKFIEKELKIR